MQAILPDQMMCSVILKVANSAFFGIPRGGASIERAVVVLGYEEIRNIVIGKAILGSLPKLPKATRQTLGLFWKHAFTCGLAAKIMGVHLGISPTDRPGSRCHIAYALLLGQHRCTRCRENFQKFFAGRCSTLAKQQSLLAAGNSRALFGDPAATS